MEVVICSLFRVQSTSVFVDVDTKNVITKPSWLIIIYCQYELDLQTPRNPMLMRGRRKKLS